MKASPLEERQPADIVVFRALQLGDMLCAVPALRALRNACPRARITLVGLPWAEAFAARYPDYIDHFVSFPGYPGFPEREPAIEAIPGFLQEMQRRRFDMALQMHGDGSTSNAVVALFGAGFLAGFGPARRDARAELLPFPEEGNEIHRLLALTHFIGAPSSGDGLEFPIRDEDEQELARHGLHAGPGDADCICLHAGARHAGKRWPAECFAAVGDALHAATGLPLVLTGSAAEAAVTAEVRKHLRSPSLDAAKPIGVGALAALLRRARLVVSNDTGVAHLAAALRLPSVIVFRAAELSRWAPLDRSLHRSVWAPQGGARYEGLSEVLAHARALLARNSPDATAPAQGA